MKNAQLGHTCTCPLGVCLFLAHDCNTESLHMGAPTGNTPWGNYMLYLYHLGHPCYNDIWPFLQSLIHLLIFIYEMINNDAEMVFFLLFFVSSSYRRNEYTALGSSRSGNVKRDLVVAGWLPISPWWFSPCTWCTVVVCNMWYNI